MIVNVTKDNFELEIAKYEGVVLVDFWASWCGPCRRFGEVLEVLSKEKIENLKIAKINIDEEEDLAEVFRVMSIPTVLIYKNGELKENFLGGRSLEDLKEILKQYL
jgi:thioredoxin 1